MEERLVSAKSGQGKDVPCKMVSEANRRVGENVRQETSQYPKVSGNGIGGSPEHPNSTGIPSVKANGSPVASAEAFVALVNQGIDCWYQAGQMLVAWRKLVPDCFKLITKANPWLSTSVLEMFVRIGNKTLHPKVLLLPPMLANRAAKLDYSEQAKLVTNTPEAIRKNLKGPSKPNRPHERSLAEKLPTVGYFKLAFADGEVVAQETGEVRWAVPIVLDSGGECWVQLLKP